MNEFNSGQPQPSGPPVAPAATQGQPAAPTAPPPAATVTATGVQAVIVERKSPGLAGFLSFFPGLGHVYLGLYQRGFAIGGAFILGIAMASHGDLGAFFGPIVAFVWFFAIIDAVRQAKAINRGQLAEAGFVGEQQLKAAAGSGGLTWGVILVGLGGLWLIDRYVDVDWSFMQEWGGPAAFILLGLILIVSHVRKRRRENEAHVGMPPRST